MSWCGGGEIRVTPGVVCRTRAMSALTLWPGSCPPSPGFAPWAILIWRSSALTRYSLVTPEAPGAPFLVLRPQFAAGGQAAVRGGAPPPSPRAAPPAEVVHRDGDRLV